MVEKFGRERQFIFRGPDGPADPGTQWMFGMLLELGDRVYDQVVHLPSAVLNARPEGTYLSPARVVLHLIGSDLRMFQPLLSSPPVPRYQETVSRTTSGDFETMETGHVNATELLKEHLAFRREFLVPPCWAPGFLEQPVEHPSFVTKRDLLGHLIWHWSFHSGHIGAVTLELGYEYHWTSTKVPSRT